MNLKGPAAVVAVSAFALIIQLKIIKAAKKEPLVPFEIVADNAGGMTINL
jgi:hypothetical protein